MTSEAQCCDDVVTTLFDVATKIQPKPNVATTSCASWAAIVLTSHRSYTAFLLDVRCAAQSGHVPFFAAVYPR